MLFLPYFACFAIIGDASAGSRNQLEKYMSRYLTSEATKIPEISKDNILRNKSRSQKGAWRQGPGSRGGPLPRVHPRARVGPTPGPCGPPSGSPSAYYFPLT